MNVKLLMLLGTAIGLTPAVLWAMASLVTFIVSFVFRPVTFSFRLYSEHGSRFGVIEYHELPLFTSLLILGGATLLIFGIASIPSPRWTTRPPATKGFTPRRCPSCLLPMKILPRLFFLCLIFVVVIAHAEPEIVDTTPKLENLNKQIATNPKDVQALSNRAYTYALLGRKEEARADLKAALALKDSGPMQNRAGWAYFNLGDYAEAVRCFEVSAKASEYRMHYDYYSLVLGYWGTGKTKLALENYQLAVEKDPRFGEYKTLNERTSEWTPLERRAIHEIYILWSKTWKL